MTGFNTGDTCSFTWTTSTTSVHADGTTVTDVWPKISYYTSSGNSQKYTVAYQSASAYLGLSKVTWTATLPNDASSSITFDVLGISVCQEYDNRITSLYLNFSSITFPYTATGAFFGQVYTYKATYDASCDNEYQLYIEIDEGTTGTWVDYTAWQAELINFAAQTGRVQYFNLHEPTLSYLAKAGTHKLRIRGRNAYHIMTNTNVYSNEVSFIVENCQVTVN